LLQKVLQGKGVHHRTEHSHIVGPATIHSPLAQLGAAKKVSATDDNCDFNTGRSFRDFPGDLGDNIGIYPQLATAKGLSGEFE
jgi:hypothetical protein